LLKSLSQRNSIVQGAMLTVAMRWCNRLISIVSTLILARLLEPDDFGIVSLAFMVLAFIQIFLEFGISIQLVQNANATEDHFHSAWTLQLIQTGIVALLIAASATFAADYFRDQRLIPVLWVLAVNVLIGGLQNIGIVQLQKNMQFGLELRFIVINRVATFVFVVAGAWLLRSYWAMIIGGTLGGVFTVVHSYIAHPMRPRWNTSRLREMFSVSQWLLLRNIGMYADQNLHKLLVGRRTDTATMGSYALASDVAGMPSSELLQPINRVLFPAFASAKRDLLELRRLFLLAQSLQVLVAVPAGTAVALMAHEIVALLFGQKWMSAAPFLQVLALAAVIEAVSTSAGYVNLTMGRFKALTALIWAQVLLFVALAFAFASEGGALRVAELRVSALSIGLLLQFVFVLQSLQGLSLGQMVAGVWRPLSTCALLWVPTKELETLVTAGPLPLVLLKGGLWATLYPSTIWLLWRASGRPAGAEQYLIDKLAGAWQSRQRKRSLAADAKTEA
jgi:O-antigen/teichoic acid export membrane protein